MVKLLIATDHEFLQVGDEVYDNYCFDREFFEDYRAVFDQVTVVSRVKELRSIPLGASRSDGDGVRFSPVRPTHGWQWALAADLLVSRAVARAVEEADVVVARVPSQLGRLAVREWTGEMRRRSMVFS